MEIRKVQVTGGSSFVITLPKEWADKQKVKKNDPLGLVVQPDGTLLVTKDLAETPLQREKVFDVTSVKDPRFLFRLLIASYIAGYTAFRVASRNRLPSAVRLAVRDFSQMTIGPEVIEETENAILLKDLLNPGEMPLDNTIRRMYVIAKNMHIDAMNVLESGNGSLAADVIARDNDVDRLHWLIARQTHIILKNPSVGRRMGVDPSLVVNTYNISRIIERIGDHGVRLARNAQNVPPGSLNGDLYAALRQAHTLSLSIFDKSIHCLFTKDIRGADANIEKTRELVATCRTLGELSLRENPSSAIILRDIAESIRRAGEYAGDISENVINMLIGEE
ncbi:MAG: PhoU domain-containing protein [Methanolinea sp.]|jgi:phosphate uptake regulator|nr:PhoU domain-containing protein [Methanolinea sp.]